MVNEKILDLVTQETILKELWKNLTKEYNLTETRERRNIRFRHAFFTAIRNNADLSLIATAKLINKDHATVLHAVKQHESNYLYDKIYRQIYDHLTTLIIKELSDYRLDTKPSRTVLSSLNPDAQLKLENKNLNRQIKELHKNYDLLKEQHELELKRITKMLKQAQEDKIKTEAKLADFKRRYML